MMTVFEYQIVSIGIVAFYTLFAPEAFFHNIYSKENPEIFDRWKDKRLAWNIHQSFMHFVGSLIGVLALYPLIFHSNLANPSKYGIVHLVLLMVGVAGVMGLIPRILFGSKLSK